MLESKHQCISCEKTSEERVLLQAEKQGKAVWVCVRCLPALIHGTEE
jgi:hypothetical protein